MQTFETGAQEASVIENRRGERYFRLMHPLLTNPSCLRCHEEQDRKVGAVRGGISVTVPLSRFATAGENLRLTTAHLGLWLVGLGGLFLTAASLRRQLHARHQVETERERLIAELQEALANVKTLRGLIPICSSCKKVRNDQGYWTQLETYLSGNAPTRSSATAFAWIVSGGFTRTFPVRLRRALLTRLLRPRATQRPPPPEVRSQRVFMKRTCAGRDAFHRVPNRRRREGRGGTRPYQRGATQPAFRTPFMHTRWFAPARGTRMIRSAAGFHLV